MSRAHALLLLPALLVTACTESSGSSAEGTPAPSEAGRPAAAQLARPGGVAVVPGTTGPELATATSEAVFASSPVVVVAAPGDGPAQARAASFAVATGLPMLLSPAESSASAAPAAVAQEVDRLGAGTVLAFGSGASSWAQGLGDDVEVVTAPDDADDLRRLAGGRLGQAKPTPAAAVRRSVADLPLDGAAPLLELSGAPAAGGEAPGGELPELADPERQDGLVVLAPAAVPDGVAAVATARAAGAEVHLLTTPDLRASSDAVRSVAGGGAGGGAGAVVALGSAFGAAEQLSQDVEVARAGVELPGGGHLVLPGKLYVALYGHPGSDALGVLGEQDVAATVARAKRVAAEYEAAGSAVPVVPTFEIITTVASAALGEDRDYSAESTLEHVRPLVEAAGREGIYVVLDLQPGYDDFLTQAKTYEPLLRLPHVGLALDPEWRLKPGQRHFGQIGSVGADEVNSVVTWLADLTRTHALPQKMLLLHQFKTYMLEDRERIDTTRRELSVVTQMDGLGSPSTKLETWNVLRPGSPPGMRWGWKNFYDEDTPTLTPRQTLEVRPTPVFVSYQ